jgi:arginine/lysine/ornithine decarboxylase
LSYSQQEAPLLGALGKFAAYTEGRFHVPGHGGRSAPPDLEALLGPGLFKSDLTELPGLDDLGNPTGIIRRAQRLAALAFGADSTFFMVNGSTAGLQALVTACSGAGDRLLLPRNTHRSVLGGLIISGAEPVFLNPCVVPGFNFAAGLSRAEVARGLAGHPGAAALLLIHPGYYGVAGDTGSHAAAAHEAGVAVIADEAHGSHWHFHPRLPADALSLGADAAVQSLHKTGGSLTQTALTHLRGRRIDYSRVAGAIVLLQTSSPSYPLLASLDAARRRLALEGEGLLQEKLQTARSLREKLNAVKGIEVFGGEHLDGDGAYAYDPLRVVVSVRGAGLYGCQAAGLLAGRHGIFVEMADRQNLVLVVGLGTEAGHCDQLLGALKDIIAREARPAWKDTGSCGYAPVVAAAMTPREAWFAPCVRRLLLEEAAGKISAEWLGVFPPGIPALIPGEEISREMLEYLLALRASGIHVQGCSDSSLNTLRVIDQ